MTPAGGPTGGQDDVLACCAALYGHPLAELVVGDSLHPGGLAGTRELLAAAGLRPGARLLDAGSGLGASARLAAGEFGFQVDAVDVSSDALARAAAREPAARIRWQQADLRALPFETGAFDAVLAECVLSTTDRRSALAELRRVLRPGGRLLLSDVVTSKGAIPALELHPVLGAALCVTAAWGPGELDSALAESGFSRQRRWDRATAILELVDRAEARIALAALAVRDLGIDLAALGAAAGLDGGGIGGRALAEPASVRRLADQVRAAVRSGALGYVAVVATAATGEAGAARVPGQARRRASAIEHKHIHRPGAPVDGQARIGPR
jgi:ubiquinone/menaquinone biosynthesis C-methylase UbiE